MLKHATGPITTTVAEVRTSSSPQSIRREQQEINRATEIVSAVYADVPPVVPAPRRVPGPLTYADLAVPLQQLPDAIRQKSAKPAVVLPAPFEHGQILDVPPAMQRLPLTQQSGAENPNSPFHDPTGRSVLSEQTAGLAPITTSNQLIRSPATNFTPDEPVTSLRQTRTEAVQQVSQRQSYASSSEPAEQTYPTPERVQMPDPLPAPTPDPAQRVRHWIRQPK